MTVVLLQGNMIFQHTLYTTIVRPHLEYASPAWSPNRKGDTKAREAIQRRATKIVPNIKNLAYDERLKSLGLTTLEERRNRGDLIQYFKCVKGLNIVNWYHPNNITTSVNSEGPASSIRDHTHRLVRQFTRGFTPRDNFLINRIVPLWNSLPREIVNADSVNSFKNKYDKLKLSPLIDIN